MSFPSSAFTIFKIRSAYRSFFYRKKYSTNCLVSRKLEGSGVFALISDVFALVCCLNTLPGTFKKYWFSGASADISNMLMMVTLPFFLIEPYICYSGFIKLLLQRLPFDLILTCPLKIFLCYNYLNYKKAYFGDDRSLAERI